MKMESSLSILNFIFTFPTWHGTRPFWMGLAQSINWYSHLIMLNWAESEFEPVGALSGDLMPTIIQEQITTACFLSQARGT